MTARYYSSLPIQNERVTLDGDEAHHLLHVMRAKPGDRVDLFDGSGWEFAAEVAVCQRRTVELAIRSRQVIDRELLCPLVMGVSLPKGDRQKWLVEKLTELGVTELVPLQTERSVAQPGEAAISRLTRAVIEACKQCGRNRLTRILPPVAFADFIVERSANRDSLRLIADPTGLKIGEIAPHGSIASICAIGPEGGFSEQELLTAKSSGWEVVSLGPRILRIETAAVALAARLASE